MTLPRQVLPGECYMVTRRCTQRQFLMRPDEPITQAFEYCLAAAAENFGVELLFCVAMSNHHHTGIRDVEGRYPEFLAYFHKLFAKCANALRGRWENFWSNEQTSMVRLVDSEDILDKLVYAVTNPVKAQLVEKSSDWPGATSLASNLKGEDRVIARPKNFFRDDGPMPESVTLRYRRPPGFESISQKDWSTLLGARIRRIEREALSERQRLGTRVLGIRGIFAQKWTARPKDSEPRRGLNPKVAAKNVWRRVEALRRNQLFLRAYRYARKTLDDGFNYAVFPEGSYWIMRFMRVVGETLPLVAFAP